MRLLRLPGVFEPHSDSWLLAEQLRREGLREGARVLDLCSGSGILAIAAAQEGADVVAVDISRRAQMTITLNARLNGVRVKALRGDLFKAVGERRFDLIVSNPPYLPDPTDSLPQRGAARAWEAGLRGRSFIDRICAEASRHLETGGVMLLVHSSVCGERETHDALAEHGFRPDVVVRRPGSLGPRLASRVDWLREQGLIGADGMEEMLIIRAEHLPHPPLRVPGDASTSVRTSGGVHQPLSRPRR